MFHVLTHGYKLNKYKYCGLKCKACKCTYLYEIRPSLLYICTIITSVILEIDCALTIDELYICISGVLEDGEPSFCAACRNEVEEGEFVHALNQDWHLECFRFVSIFCCIFLTYFYIEFSNIFIRCSACDAALSSWYFEKDGLLFCKDDYCAKFGESCQQCGQVTLVLNYV